MKYRGSLEISGAIKIIPSYAADAYCHLCQRAVSELAPLTHVALKETAAIYRHYQVYLLDRNDTWKLK